MVHNHVEKYVQNSFLENPRQIRYAVNNKKVAHSIYDEKCKQWAILSKLQSIFIKMVQLESKVTMWIVSLKVSLTIGPKIMA